MLRFLVGLFVIWFAIGSPFAHMDHQLLTIHMVKHLLLMATASPLILWAAHPFINNNRQPSVIESVACWLAGTGTVLGWHVPAMFQFALRSAWAHGLEQASFLLGGFLFWWPVAQGWRNAAGGTRWSVPIYLFLATIPCDILSAFLVFCGRVVYPPYLDAPQHFGFSPLQDQEFAGALMWVAITFIYLVPAFVLVVELLSPAANRRGVMIQQQVESIRR